MPQEPRPGRSEAPIRKELHFADIGFSDRSGFYQLGLAQAPIHRKIALTPQGEKVHLLFIDQPITGKGLVHLLNAASPGFGMERGGIIGDWKLPDEARELMAQGDMDNKTVQRHKNHEQFPAYREFDANHRTRWMRVLSDQRYDLPFDLVTKQDIVNPTIFTQAKLAEWQNLQGEGAEIMNGWMFGYLSQMRKGIAFADQLETFLQAEEVDENLHERARNLFGALHHTKEVVDARNREEAAKPDEIHMHGLWMYLEGTSPQESADHFATLLDIIQSPHIPQKFREDLVMSFSAFSLNRFGKNKLEEFVDPVTGQSWAHATEWDQPSTKIAVHAHRKGQQTILDYESLTLLVDTSRVDSTGHYSTIQNVFKPEPTTPVMRPLIAFVETSQGRRFLTQEEASQYIPPSWGKQESDVMLGRIALAYFQPEVTENFLMSMRYPKRRGQEAVAAGHPNPVPDTQQDIDSAQMPVWVSFPGYAKHLLASAALTAAA